MYYIESTTDKFIAKSIHFDNFPIIYRFSTVYLQNTIIKQMANTDIWTLGVTFELSRLHFTHMSVLNFLEIKQTKKHLFEQLGVELYNWIKPKE